MSDKNNKTEKSTSNTTLIKLGREVPTPSNTLKPQTTTKKDKE